jgi:Flp pilus assembly protein TadG
MRNRPRRRFLGERGAAAVEFAILAPVLLTLLFGIVECAQLFQVQSTLSAAAREGVRSMALGNNLATARTTAREAASPVPVVAASIVFSRNSCAGASATTSVTVTITHRQPFASGFLGRTGVNLTGQAVMRCGG